MSTPVSIRSTICHAPSRSTHLLVTLAALMAALMTVLPAGFARASEPAVKALNVRALARYDYTHVDSEEVFRFTPPPPVLDQSTFGEEDIDAGAILGFVTLPIEHSLGARFFAGPTGSKRHVDRFDATRSYGFELGGDLFWRDPEVGELGIGPRYLFSSSTTGGVDRTTNSVGADVYGVLFVQDFGVGAIDLRGYLGFLHSESDPEAESDGTYSGMSNFRAGGNATLYVSDFLALGLGGSWSRSNFGNGGESLDISSADIDIDVLVPVVLPITLGAEVSIGRQERSAAGFAQFGRDFFSIGVSLTLSFTDASSLLELNRFYY